MVAHYNPTYKPERQIGEQYSVLKESTEINTKNINTTPTESAFKHILFISEKLKCCM